MPTKILDLSELEKIKAKIQKIVSIDKVSKIMCRPLPKQTKMYAIVVMKIIKKITNFFP